MSRKNRNKNSDNVFQYERQLAEQKRLDAERRRKLIEDEQDMKDDRETYEAQVDSQPTSAIKTEIPKVEAQTKPKKRSDRVLGPNLGFLAKEAYNLLRTNLFFSFPDKEGCKTIGITSANPQEGKSTTSINVAYSLAEAGYNVLLVEADMRRPAIATALGLQNTNGLSTLLVGAKDVQIHKNILSTSLCVLTSGPIPPNPSELVGSANMKHIINTFSKAFDYIIFDLPPINAVSDPLILSKYLDGVALVVRHGYSKKSDVLEAVGKIKFTNVRVLGFIYNCFSKEGRGYYYNRKQKYYRRSYYSSDKSSEK